MRKRESMISNLNTRQSRTVRQEAAQYLYVADEPAEKKNILKQPTESVSFPEDSSRRP